MQGSTVPALSKLRSDAQQINPYPLDLDAAEGGETAEDGALEAGSNAAELVAELRQEVRDLRAQLRAARIGQDQLLRALMDTFDSLASIPGLNPPQRPKGGFAGDGLSKRRKKQP